MRFWRILIGWLLLPCGATATLTLIRLVAAAAPAGRDAVLSAAAFGAGALFWLLAFWALPVSARGYIVAHELTHALWGLLQGARISRLRISRTGGSVQVSERRILTTLAPYFFSLYTALVMGLYYGLALFFDLTPWYEVWLGAIGWTLAFHFSWTVAALAKSQPDIRVYGRVFSYALIYVLNVLGLGLLLVLLSSVTLEQWVSGLAADAGTVWGLACRGAIAGWSFLRTLQ